MKNRKTEYVVNDRCGTGQCHFGKLVWSIGNMFPTYIHFSSGSLEDPKLMDMQNVS